MIKAYKSALFGLGHNSCWVDGEFDELGKTNRIGLDEGPFLFVFGDILVDGGNPAPPGMYKTL